MTTENTSGRELAEQTLRGVVEEARRAGVSLTAEQGAAVCQLLAGRLAELSGKGLTREEFARQGGQAALECIRAVLDASAIIENEAASRAAIEALAHALKTGGYKESPEKLEQVRALLMKEARTILARKLDQTTRVQQLRECAAWAVRQVFGEPRNPAAFN
ncbi:hypothetical protein F0U62_18670 [Cystobacter fuscus]|uniref:hypothetical protein n=1 Tax=Cystobacter fuscus TaxID=43 RepID=UPI002B2AD41C|nr:hypothetical protein F0U62_18670 [Cystobacter fuscus]